MTTPKPRTPHEIRGLLWADLAQVSDVQLLTLLLATGTVLRRGGRKPEQSWSALELAEALVAEAGGRFAGLVEKVRAGALDFAAYGIGKSVGARLIAAMELAARWRRGLLDEPRESGALGVGSGDAEQLSEKVFRRQGKPSAVELVALVLGGTWPDLAAAERLLTAFGSPRELFATLSLEAFESFSRKSRTHLRLKGTEVELELAAFCRLLAGVELARRYRAQQPESESRCPGSRRLGLRSAELVQLLDPRCPLESDQRQRLLGVLKSHPELTADFAELDQLLRAAGTASYARALELHEMFEQLRAGRQWSNPADVLGQPVPYRQLLAIAEAKIERAARPPARILKVKQLLEEAEQAAAARVIADCQTALLALEVSESGVVKAFEAAQRGTLEKLGEPGTLGQSTAGHPQDAGEKGGR